MCEVVELGGLEWDKNSDLYQVVGDLVGKADRC